MTLKKCPACGKSFECSHDEHCWCTLVALNDVTRSELKKRFTDCLCKACLEEINEVAKKNLAK